MNAITKKLVTSLEMLCFRANHLFDQYSPLKVCLALHTESLYEWVCQIILTEHQFFSGSAGGYKISA